MIIVSNAIQVKEWRRRTKQRIIDSFGGKCGLCSYNKCQEALELHHLNPEEKEFTFGSIRANPKNWVDITTELKKCVLLCSNCHREVHANLTTIDLNTISRFNEAFINYKNLTLDDTQSITNDCPICGNKKPLWQKTCSKSCATHIKGKYNWTDFNLKDLIITQNKSYSEVAKLIGCSILAIKKRLIKEGIKPPFKSKIIVWPERKILEALVKEKSLVKIAEELNVSHTGLRKHLKKLGIKWDVRGAWQKRYAQKTV